MISVVGKSIHYDGAVAPVVLSNPEECGFALDGVRLVRNEVSHKWYQYETAQGFILVENSNVNCYRFTKDHSKEKLLTTMIDSYGNRYSNYYTDMTDPHGCYYPTNSTHTAYYHPFIAPINLLTSNATHRTNIEYTYRLPKWPTLYIAGQLAQKKTVTTREGMTWEQEENITYNSMDFPKSRITYIGGNKVNESHWILDKNGNVTEKESAPYNVTKFLRENSSYDDNNNLILTKDVFGHLTKYADHDKNGNARVITDHKGRVTSRTFDTWGNLLSSKAPDGTIETVKTDWGGEGLYTVTKSITGKPTTITHYDALGREIRTGVLRFDGQWQFVDKIYDSRGRLEKVSLPFKGASPKYWNTYIYDEYNRPISFT